MLVANPYLGLATTDLVWHYTAMKYQKGSRDDEVFLRYRTKHSIALLSCVYCGTVIIHNSTDYLTMRIYKKNYL